MMLEEYKTYLAFDIMRKIATEIGFKETNPSEAYSILQNIEPDFFICWSYRQRKAVVLYGQEHGFSYLLPSGSGVVAGRIDEWQSIFEKIVIGLNPSIDINISKTWNCIKNDNNEQRAVISSL